MLALKPIFSEILSPKSIEIHTKSDITGKTPPATSKESPGFEIRR